MSRFIDRFENHALHGVLAKTIATVNELMVREGNQSNAIIELERVKQVSLAFKDALDNCDPNLVYIGYLDSIQNNHLNNVLGYLNNYRNDRNISHLHTANNQLDGCLTSMANILMPKFPNDIDGIRESIVSFRRSASQHLRHTEEEFKKIESVRSQLEQGLSQVASTVETQKSRLDTAIAEFQQQFSQAEDSRRQQFSNAEEERRKEYDQHVEEQTNEYDLLQKDREEHFKAETRTYDYRSRTIIKRF